jgi:hypothetical protein
VKKKVVFFIGTQGLVKKDVLRWEIEMSYLKDTKGLWGKTTDKNNIEEDINNYPPQKGGFLFI